MATATELGTALSRLGAGCGLVAYSDDCSASLSIWTSTLIDIPTIFFSVGDNFLCAYYCICTVHVIRSLNCQYQHMHNFNVTG